VVDAEHVRADTDSLEALARASEAAWVALTFRHRMVWVLIGHHMEGHACSAEFVEILDAVRPLPCEDALPGLDVGGSNLLVLAVEIPVLSEEEEDNVTLRALSIYVGVHVINVPASRWVGKIHVQDTQKYTFRYMYRDRIHSMIHVSLSGYA
jgi:hypothetical protein